MHAHIIFCLSINEEVKIHRIQLSQATWSGMYGKLERYIHAYRNKDGIMLF